MTDSAVHKLADSVLIPPFDGVTAPRWLLSALGDGLAGVTLFAPNMADGPEALADLTASLRAAGGDPLVAADEEGGDVTRIWFDDGSPYPGNAALGAVDDTHLTERIYASLARDLSGVGVNVDLAPCLDVLAAASNPVVGTRSFGSSAALVARHGAAAVRGLQSGGVAACAKHFPGHGSTTQDSHSELAVVSGGMTAVEERDLPPFRAAIEAGVRTVMPGHLQVPGLTGDLPASLSAAALGLLRSMGFSGTILTDALEMRAVSDPYGLAGASVRALAAGCDLLCLGRDVGQEGYLESRAAIVDAVRSGALPGDRLEEAAARVSALRSQLAAARDGGGIFPDGAGTDRDEAGLDAARKALRLTGPRPELRDPVVIEVEPVLNMAQGRAHWGLARWVHPDDVVRLAASPDPKSAAAAAAQAAHGRALLLVVRDAHRSVSIQMMVRALLARRPDAVVVEVGLPYWQPPAGTFRAYLATYGASRASTRAAVEFLGLAGVMELGLEGGPDLLGGEGHVEVADAARAQRVQDGVHHRGGGA